AADGGVSPQDAARIRLRSPCMRGVLQRRAVLESVCSLDRGPFQPRHRGGMRRRQLLPDESDHPRPDVGVPDEAIRIVLKASGFPPRSSGWRAALSSDRSPLHPTGCCLMVPEGITVDPPADGDSLANFRPRSRSRSALSQGLAIAGAAAPPCG